MIQAAWTLNSEFQFLHVKGEVKNHLYGRAGVAVLVIAVYIRLELPAVADDLLTTLLKRDLHVLPVCSTDIGPQGDLLTVLLYSSHVLGAHCSALSVRNMLLTHRASEMVSALVDKGGRMRPP